MPPPTTIWSTFSDKLSNTVSLVETLLPPTMATMGRAGLSKALPKASNSLTNKMPAAATAAYLATPWVEASALWAVPKASMTNTSHSLAYFCDKSSLFFFSPTLKRQFSSTTNSPAATATSPSNQFLIKRTGRLSFALITSTTGCNEFSSEYTPSSGRPKCEVTMTLAPAFKAKLMVAMEALMRASDVTLPLLTGTFKSARIKTRLPCKFKSVILITAMLFLF